MGLNMKKGLRDIGVILQLEYGKKGTNCSHCLFQSRHITMAMLFERHWKTEEEEHESFNDSIHQL